jgi:hypothetical protein
VALIARHAIRFFGPIGIPGAPVISAVVLAAATIGASLIRYYAADRYQLATTVNDGTAMASGSAGRQPVAKQEETTQVADGKTERWATKLVAFAAQARSFGCGRRVQHLSPEPVQHDDNGTARHAATPFRAASKMS